MKKANLKFLNDFGVVGCIAGCFALGRSLANTINVFKNLDEIITLEKQVDCLSKLVYRLCNETNNL